MQISDSAKTTAAIVAVLLIPAAIFAYNAYEVANERNQQISSASTSQDSNDQALVTPAPAQESAEEVKVTETTPESNQANAEQPASVTVTEAPTIVEPKTSLVIDKVKVLPNTSSIEIE